jgi:hypothetical protein
VYDEMRGASKVVQREDTACLDCWYGTGNGKRTFGGNEVAVRVSSGAAEQKREGGETIVSVRVDREGSGALLTRKCKRE